MASYALPPCVLRKLGAAAIWGDPRRLAPGLGSACRLEVPGPLPPEERRPHGGDPGWAGSWAARRPGRPIGLGRDSPEEAAVPCRSRPEEDGAMLRPYKKGISRKIGWLYNKKSGGRNAISPPGNGS